MTTDAVNFLDAAAPLLERWWRDEQPLHATLQGGPCQAQRNSGR